MQNSVSKLIIIKWIAGLEDSNIGSFAVEQFQNLADDNALDDEKKLKGAIGEIEENNAKNQDANG